MKEIIISDFKIPFGELSLGSFEGKLCLCDWKYRKMRKAIDKRISSGLDAEYTPGECDVIANLKKQFGEYFQSKRRDFCIPLRFVGTDFQVLVWNQLLQIPFGEKISYLELSELLGNQKAIRAVATANGANALSIVVPCHRVVGTNGKLVGYAGGLNAKKGLLSLEGTIRQQSFAF
ncbi:MAG: methylated-DNA--[protein]-cysteine S-methyltransferase [Bacteroidota bacterium]